MLLPSAVLKKPGAATPIMPTSVCWDIDATQSASYSGTGTTWSNLVASPNDGAGQTAYDFTLVSSPTFTGSAGSGSAYFLMSGSNYFKTLNTFSNALTLYNSHKTTSKWWMAFTGQLADTTSYQIPYGNANTSSDLGTSVTIAVGASTDYRAYQAYGSGTVNKDFGNILATSTPYVIIVSIDLTSSTNNVRIWKNTRTKTQSSVTWHTTTANTSTTFYGLAATCTGTNSVAANLSNNSRLYGFSGGNDFIDDTDAGKIFDVYNNRTGRTYA